MARRVSNAAAVSIAEPRVRVEASSIYVRATASTLGKIARLLRVVVLELRRALLSTVTPVPGDGMCISARASIQCD